MPSLKVKVNTEAKSAFESYDGPEVPVGNGYEGVIKSVRVKQSDNENKTVYLNVVVEHKSDDATRKQYNGAVQFVRVFFGDHDETQARLSAFIKAVTGKANKEANIVDTDVEARTGTGSIVKTIDGVNPNGKPVKFDVRMEAAQNGYPARTTADFLRRIVAAPAKDEDPGQGIDEVDEDDIEVEGDDEELEVELSREEREKELKAEPIKALREAAKEAEIDITGLKKADLVEAILDWEYEDADEDEDEDAEEEDEVELDEDESEGDEEDEEEGDEEEDDEEEEDAEPELRAELAILDRAALKSRLKESDDSFKILKRHTDDDLRDAIVAAELSDTPF